MLTLLFWLGPIAAIAGIVWLYRRKTAERKAASNERLKVFFDQTAGGSGAADVPPAPFVTPSAAPSAAPFSETPTAPPAEAPAARAPVVQPSMRYAVRERLLSSPQTLLYFLLKSSLSDHEVLAQVSAAAVIDVPDGVGGLEREARQRRLAAVVLDFVVCDKSLRAVAVVQWGARTGVAAEATAFARACCESAGLRWIDMAPDALPRREMVRAVVLGSVSN